VGDKGTVGDMRSEFENLGERLKVKVLARAEGVIEFTEAQLLDVAELADDVALSLAGDERAMQHLKAQLALKKFSVAARAYLEGAAFRTMLAESIMEIVAGLVSVGAKVAGEALAGMLSGALGDLG